MNDLLLIIDNWKYKADGSVVNGKLSENIIKFIEQNDNIKTVVLASYACSLELFSDTIWYSNRRKTIANYEEYVYGDYTTNLARNLQTWERMLNYVNSNVYQIAMRDVDELVKYIEECNVNNIYMAGAAWEICVRNRPLGYENIRKNIPNVNIFTDVSCIVDSNSNTPDMSQYKYWKHLEAKMYQYIG